MGWELVVEATCHGPETLTWRERYALLVLAGAAADASRECPPGIEDIPEIVARLRLSRSARYEVIKSLCDKGALLHAERGRNGVAAVYLIAPLAPGAVLGGPAGPVDNPVKGPGNLDASGAVKGPGFPDASVLKGPGFTAEGSGFDPAKGPGNPDPWAAGTVFFKSDQEDKSDSITHARTREVFRAAVPGVTDDEIDETIRVIRIRYNVRNIDTYIKRLARNDDLAQHIPCGLGDKKHSNNCRSRDCGKCTASWCEGRCHGARAAARAGEAS